jgi:hypothetical protein
VIGERQVSTALWATLVCGRGLEVRKIVARAFLAASGWEPEGERPKDRRFVLVADPHTSNWDLAYPLALADHFEVRVSWMG